ncbi:hypothetical protein AGMMS50276_08430 [Synergistales bacterium]|nr:hypothetical protein AGMMS50276_08430 [Synergistales bacterium]
MGKGIWESLLNLIGTKDKKEASGHADSISNKLNNQGTARVSKPKQEASQKEDVVSNHNNMYINFDTNAKAVRTSNFRQETPQMENVVVSGSGNMYINFDKNADDNVNNSGRRFPGLRTQLKNLRKKHKNQLFPDLSENDDFLARFQECFFPNDFTVDYLVSNISFDDKPYLAIRPYIIGPRLDRELPIGLSLMIRCYVQVNPRNQDSPELVVQRIDVVSHSRPRDFERRISASIQSTEEKRILARTSQEYSERNVMKQAFVNSLPHISQITKERIKDWSDYLSWRDRYIRSRVSGLRYFKADFTKSEYKFLAVAESKESFDNALRYLKQGDCSIFPLNYSENPWGFAPKENTYVKRIPLGNYISSENAAFQDQVDGMPWDKPFCAYIHFQLPDEDQGLLDEMKDDKTLDTDIIANRFLKDIPKDGFLALDVTGDSVLIRRQREILGELERGEGYAPFLSSYMFDIKAASEPRTIREIADDAWMRKDLNEDQKLSVRKMISVPDLGLIQGPPGTGKTTMIAEAVYQFVCDGKKVLLASQANLAVDNVLERLEQIPDILAIRLGKKGEEDNPYSEKNAYKTYYRAIAQKCRKDTLNVWRDNEEKLEFYNRWLDDTASLRRDINQLSEIKSSVSLELRDIGNEKQKKEEESAQAEATLSELRQVDDFIEAFHSGQSWDGRLPNEILREFFDEIVTPLTKLEEIGISMNNFWSAFDEKQTIEQSVFAAKVLRRWNGLKEQLPRLSEDCARLKILDTETLMTPEDAAHLDELNRRGQKLHEELLENDGVLKEYRDVKLEISDIKKRSGGLDREVYSGIFDKESDGVKAYLSYTEPSSRSELLKKLEEVLSAIHSIEKSVEDGINRLETVLKNYRGRADRAIEDDAKLKSELKSLEGRERAADTRISELDDQIAKKTNSLLGLIKNNGVESQVNGDSYEKVRKVIEQEAESIKTILDQTKTTRDTWGPILKSWVDSLENPNPSDMKIFSDEYTKACNVVGVTCTENRRTLEDAGHVWFDVAIVDEVSKATPTEIIMPLMMAKTAILVGDHRQLPPTFKGDQSYKEAAEEQLEENVNEADGSELTEENYKRFEKMVSSSLFKEHFENAGANLKASLTTQYRMHPQIMDAINQFYDMRLVCGLKDPDAKDPHSAPAGHRLHGLTLTGLNGKPYVTPDQHVAWINSKLDPIGKSYTDRKLGSSRVNDVEAALIAKCLYDIEMAYREMGYGKDGKGPRQVGVVSFYGRQVGVLRRTIQKFKRLKKFEFSAIKSDVNTVDRYQGQERPIIIVSMVRNPKGKLGPNAFPSQFERINVAFSRAQELLVIVGAAEVFSDYLVELPYADKPGRHSVTVYRQIYDKIYRDGGYSPSKDIMSSEDFKSILQVTEERR